MINLLQFTTLTETVWQCDIAVCVETGLIAGILVTASKQGGGYAYNTTIAVFLTECVKIIAALAMYIKEWGVELIVSCICYIIP